MIALPNNCRVGKFSVHPKNWQNSNSSANVKWYIVYWFYDDNINQKIQVSIKGMNRCNTLKEKQADTKLILANELTLLKTGYNPITKKDSSDINEYSGLLKSLEYALKHVDLEHKTRIDITNSFRYIMIAIKNLHFESIPISSLKRKHIKLILEACGEIKTYTDQKGEVKPRKWGAYQFNRYRAYLSLLMRQLVQIDAIDVNPVREIEKKPQLKRIRETTTPEQRRILKEYTSNNWPTYYRFLQMFYSSGSRITELMSIKKEDINLREQKFKITVKKGKKFAEVLRTIKTVVLPFWEEIFNEAKPNQYVFGLNLQPQHREKPLSPDAVTRRWKRHIKKKLGITADLYSLKHTHLDEISAYYSSTKEGIKKAQEAAGHSTPVITLRYLPGQEERNHNELRDAMNEL